MKVLKKLLPRVFFVLLFSTSFLNEAKCQTSDTIIFYLKYSQPRPIVVNSLAEADYFRLIFPPDKDGKRSFKEFYKNGKIKLISSMPAGSDVDPNKMKWDGDCIMYFENGKRKRAVHFTNGWPDGDEYLFYPNGTIYCFIKTIIPSGFYKKVLYLECYDDKGNMICKDGNGQWIDYGVNFKRIVLEGNVKNGYRVGNWLGQTNGSDSIRYIYKYNQGKLAVSTGFDKSGQAYPFDKEFTYAAFQGGLTNFVQFVRNRLKTPHDGLGKRISIDTMHVSFIIEKNGRPSEINVLGGVAQNVQDAVATAVSKCMDWTPTKYYGVPFRTKMELPLIYSHEFIDIDRPYDIGTDPYIYKYRTSIYYHIQVLDFNPD